MRGDRQLSGGPVLTGLADLGADVIKLEDPNTGDHMRDYGPFINGESSSFMRTNRNKKSLAVDLKAEEGNKPALDLFPAPTYGSRHQAGAMSASVSTTTFFARSIHADLCRRVGLGQDGALSELAGLDIMAQARSGIMSVTGEADGEPAKAGVPLATSPGDLCGAWCVAARRRDVTAKDRWSMCRCLKPVSPSRNGRPVATLRPRTAEVKRLCAQHQRALSGLPQRRWLVHPRRAQHARLAISAGCWTR